MSTTTTKRTWKQAMADAEAFPAHKRPSYMVDRTCLKCGKAFQVSKYVIPHGRGKFCSRACQHAACSLENHPFWKGDAAKKNVKRGRIRRRLPLGPCEHCGAEGVDRHHKDGNTGNNARSNIEILCRRCHLTTDGRLQRLISASKARDHTQPPKPCANCGRPYKPLRHGRCDRCRSYFAKYGQERPYRTDGRKCRHV